MTEVEALWACEAQSRKLVESCRIGFGIADDTFHLVYANQRMADMLGYTLDESQQLDLHSFIPPDDVQRLLAAYRQRQPDDKSPGIYQVNAIRKDGQKRRFEAHIATVRLADGQTRWLAYITDVTEKAKIEDALRRSEARFSHIFHASPVGISLSRPDDGHYLDVNDTFLAFFGYNREEVIGKTVHELNIWRDFEDREALLDRLQTEGAAHLFETQLRTKSGEIRTALASAELLEVDGETCLLALFEDITERRRIEQRFTKIVQGSPIAITISTAADGRYVEVNEAFESLFGYSRQEVIGKTSQALNLLVNSDERAGNVAQLLEQGSLEPRYFEVRHKSGRIITTLITLEAIDLDGERCILAFVVDMTERQRMDERFTRIFRDSPVAIAIATFDSGRIIDVNDAYLSLFGYSRQMVIGRTSHDLKLYVDHPASDRKKLVDELRQQVSFGPLDL